MGAFFLKREEKSVKMKPKWIKVGNTQKDLFDILNSIKHGNSLDEIAANDRSLSIEEIHKLLNRTTEYLHSHLILDSYLETANKLTPDELKEIKLEWTANEIKELVNLQISGATVASIALLIRKTETEVYNKLRSLNLLNGRD